jgi:UDP-N-acetylglucosamine acyltransferase
LQYSEINLVLSRARAGIIIFLREIKVFPMAKSNQLIPDEILHARKGVEIHPTAIVSPKAEIGEGTVVGAWCVIGEGATIGRYNTLKSNVILDGRVSIGDGSIIHNFAIIGNHSHDLKFSDDEKTPVRVGRDCVIREFTNIHAGTPNGKNGCTSVGDGAYICSHCHIGHDCEVQDHALLSQGCALGGEAVIQRYAIIGGGAAVHQFSTVGAYSIIGGLSGVTQDVLPYMMSVGIRPQYIDGINLVGLKRNGFSDDDIRVIKEVYKALFMAEGLWGERVDVARSVYGKYPVAREIFKFIDEARRTIAKPRSKFRTEGE